MDELNEAEATDGRRVFLGELSSDWRWTQPDLDRFVLFVGADASSASDEALASYAAAAISAGCVYVCAWGQDCSRVHVHFDLADLELSESAEDAVVMSTCHADESLVAALYFALELAWPPDDVDRSPLVAVVQHPWLEETRSLLCDQEQLLRLWLDDE